METRVVRDLTVLLPGEAPEDLEAVDHVPAHGDTVAGRLVTGQAWSRGLIANVTLANSWLVNADLATTRFENVSVDRCVFRGCSLVGAHLADVTLRNVVFEQCRLDYAAIDRLRTTGPTCFLGCSLIETSLHLSTLSNAAFDSCKLSATTFQTCDMRGADLRGNDLADIAGITSLRGAIVDEEQPPGLTQALIRDLELQIKNR